MLSDWVVVLELEFDLADVVGLAPCDKQVLFVGEQDGGDFG